jgi:hypothetical protein
LAVKQSAARTSRAADQSTNHDEITIALVEPADGTPPLMRVLAATPHNSRHHPLLCCGGGDGQDHRRDRNGAGTTQGGRTMSNDLKAFLLSVGGLLAVAGSGLLALWAGLTWLD